MKSRLAEQVYRDEVLFYHFACSEGALNFAVAVRVLDAYDSGEAENRGEHVTVKTDVERTSFCCSGAIIDVQEVGAEDKPTWVCKACFSRQEKPSHVLRNRIYVYGTWRSAEAFESLWNSWASAVGMDPLEAALTAQSAYAHIVALTAEVEARSVEVWARREAYAPEVLEEQARRDEPCQRRAKQRQAAVRAVTGHSLRTTVGKLVKSWRRQLKAVKS